MSQRAWHKRWQQTLLWAWLLLIAFVPQLVMKATHFHHTPSHAVASACGHHHDDHAHAHGHEHAHHDHHEADTPSDGALWQAGVATDAQACGDDCLLCQAPVLWGVVAQPQVLTYADVMLARRKAVPLHERVSTGAVYVQALRGPPVA